MLVLVVDTAGSTGGVLLARSESAPDGKDAIHLLGVSDLQSREFSVQLISAITDLLKKNHLTLAAVDVLAVVSGPGSFTGLRVGLSAVKALAETTSKPIVAVSRLAVMASMAPEAEVVHAVLDAGRGEYYHGVYRDAGWTCVAESLQTLESLSASIARAPGLVVASETSVVRALAALAPRQIAPAGVQEALPLALAAWKVGRVSDVVSLDANYLRRTDAEIISKIAMATTPTAGLGTGP